MKRFLKILMKIKKKCYKDKNRNGKLDWHEALGAYKMIKGMKGGKGGSHGASGLGGMSKLLF